MRTFDLCLLVIVLSPLAALAQEASAPAPADAPADAPVSAEAAPAPEEAPAEAAPEAPAAPAVAAPPSPPPAPVQAAPAPAQPGPSPPAPVQAAPAPVQAAPAPQQPSAPAAASPPAQPTPLPYPTSPPVSYYPVPVYQPPPPRPYHFYAPPPEPPSYVLPPLPPGYVYMPTPTQQPQQATTAAPTAAAAGPNRDELYEKLRRSELRLDELKRNEIGVGGPITMMVLGYGSSFVSGLIALSSYSAADRIQSGNYDLRYDQSELDINNDGAIDGKDSRKFNHMGKVALGVGAASLFVGIAATASLSSRRAQRREQALEIKKVSAERDSLRRQLDFGPAISAGQYGVQVQGRY